MGFRLPNFLRGFVPASLRETYAPLDNPGRGWYHIYTYEIGSGKPVLPPMRYEGETLALLLMDIGLYREKKLDEEGLQEIRGILAAFAQAGMDMILRVCYDTRGEGLEREPAVISTVLEHMEQLGPIFLEYEKEIYVYQGLFVGNWGEMHGSKFLAKNFLARLYETFNRAVQGRIPLALRRPVQYRMLVPEGQERSGLGFFDDAMFSSDTHLGTFAQPGQGGSAWEEMWDREREIAFEAPFAAKVPFGGEALAGNQDSPEKTMEILRSFQVSYLNSVHDVNCLERWKNMPAAAGETGAETLYDWIGAHLGYRLLIRETSWEKNRPEKTGRLGKHQFRIRVLNSGFAPCYRELEIKFFRKKGPSGEFVPFGKLVPDGREGFVPGREISLYCCPEQEPEAGDRIYIGAREKISGRTVSFAQVSEEPGEYLFIGCFGG